MKNFVLLASAAAMAVSMPAFAKPDKGGGNGGGKGGKVEQRGGGGDKAERKGGGGKDRQKFAERRNKDREKRVENRMKEREKFVERRVKQREKFAEQRNKRVEKRSEEQRKWAGRERDDRREVRRVRFDDDDRRVRFDDNRVRYVNNDINDGRACPPGLAKKNNGCLPPGQAKKRFALGEQMNRDWYRNYNIPTNYRSLYYDSPDNYYRYDDGGYIYRVNRESNLVSGLIPLLGGGFGVGQLLPSGYDIYNVPTQYRDTYYDTDESYYRYGDNAIYEVDPQTNMIESVVALLAGDSLGVGQMLPSGYDMYNVPMDYRDEYYDTGEYNYRYADGNIYQVDAKTQIIQAIISALV